MIPMSSITAINKTFSHWLFTRYGRIQGVLAISRIAPFGVGAVVGGAGNLAFGRVVVTTSRRVLERRRIQHQHGQQRQRQPTDSGAELTDGVADPEPAEIPVVPRSAPPNPGHPGTVSGR